MIRAAAFVCFLVLAACATPSTVNCTWKYYDQPLDHFARGLPTPSATYKQRVCFYEDYWTSLPNGTKGPILFYSGNESPVDEYVNATGLMWTLAPKLGALLVFAEHRYFGESIPDMEGVPNCLAFLSSAQALADYAMLVGKIKAEHRAEDSAVVTFGGSYGGMLSAWFRIKYPNVVDGAIAASAPIWGFPHTRPALDGAFQRITYAMSAAGGAAPRCKDNMLAAWPLIADIGETAEGRALISSAFKLCTPLQSHTDVMGLLSYAQGPFFNLAEGNYPFPSDYITYALMDSTVPLPPWPVRKACSYVAEDFGVKMTGNLSDVRFNISIGKLEVYVNWNETDNKPYSMEDVKQSGALELMVGVREAFGVWYNFTGELKCFDAHDVKNAGPPAAKHPLPEHKPEVRQPGADDNVCHPKGAFTTGMGWTGICANEGLNLVQYLVQGVGNDMYWPPNVPRSYSYDSIVAPPGSSSNDQWVEYFASQGLHGLPVEADPWSDWEEQYYGGKHIGAASNIVFSNGLFDPWMAAGVYKSLNPSLVIADLPSGGHHLDLFFPTDEDPKDALEARKVEEDNIRKWISEKNVGNLR